ncbi:MAG: HAD family hydrolase [Cyanobacteria bacterium SZAS LIN-3]|nr:HAD family hydrolase [Cyanobacteria bacterium SZAS LIN-3]
MCGPASVVLLDLWMTLVYSLPRDPILDLRLLLAPEAEPSAFARTCLTTNIRAEDAFLAHVAREHSVTATAEVAAAFAALTASERNGVQLYPDTVAVLTELKKRGKRLGLVSNLWPFPVDHIFNNLGLGAHFEHLVYSFAEGVAKPDKGIFQSAMKRFAVSADHCVMVGDSLKSDVEGAIAAGMSAILINRSGQKFALPAPSREVTNLTELLAVL